MQENRTWRELSISAIILLAILLVSGSVLLFTHTQPSQTQTSPLAGPMGKPLGPVGKPVTVTTTWDGLEMAMNVTSGPYFLSELLAVDLSITNHSHPTLMMHGWVGTGACFDTALFLRQTGGTSPHDALYTLPIPFIYNCPVMGPGFGSTLAPGQTETVHLYTLLTSSGDVTLTGTASFYLSKTDYQGSPGPLAGHFPTLAIHVASQIPTDRMLSFQPKGSQVVIQAPAGVQLIDQTYILCQDSSYHSWPGGYEDWKPLPTNTLQRPECSGIGSETITLWKYAIGAAGYAVIQDQFSGH